MNVAEITEQLQVRIATGLPGMEIVSADEAAEWPDGTLDAFVARGLIAESQPAETVRCEACFEDHVEVVQYVEEPTGSVLRAYISCPVAGRVGVDTKRMRRWRIVAPKGLAVGDTRPGHASACPCGLIHPDDFQSVRIRASELLLTSRQADVFRVLHESLLRGEPALSWGAIATRMNSSPPACMSQVFKGQPRWKELISIERRTLYRLAPHS